MKKLVALAAAGVLMLAACGGDGNSASSSSQTAATAPDTTGASTGTEPATTGGGEPSGDPIKIGWVGPLSGPAAVFGAAMADMASIYVDRINAEGGIAGRPVEFFTRDDENDPAKSVVAVEELIRSEGINVLLGPITTSAANATLQAVTDAGVLQIAGIVDGTEMNQPDKYPYSFINWPDVKLSARAVVEYMVKTLGLTKIAMMADTTASGQGFHAASVAALNDLGAELVADEQWNFGDTDYAAQVGAVKRSNPQALLLWGLAPDMHRAMLEMVTQNLIIPVGGASGLGVPAGIDIVGADTMDTFPAFLPTIGSFVRDCSGALPQSTQELIDYMKAHQDKYSIVAQGMTADQILLVKKAIEGAGGSTNAADMAKALETAGPIQLYDATYEFSATNHSGFPLAALGLAKATSLDSDQVYSSLNCG